MTAQEFNKLQITLVGGEATLDPYSHKWSTYNAKANLGKVLLMCELCNDYFLCSPKWYLYSNGAYSRNPRPLYVTSNQPYFGHFRTCRPCRVQREIDGTTRKLNILRGTRDTAMSAKTKDLERFWKKKLGLK
jgi:hypothetical protein